MLLEEPFEYQVFKDNKVQIYWNNKPVMILKGKAALELLKKLERAKGRDVQLVLAKITGNFKRGNEKTVKKVDYFTEDNYKLITISNTEHIFTSYYRGSNVRDRPGYGLGLYISKQIMKNMNGDIFAMNTDVGVSFVIVIKQA